MQPKGPQSAASQSARTQAISAALAHRVGAGERKRRPGYVCGHNPQVRPMCFDGYGHAAAAGSQIGQPAIAGRQFQREIDQQFGFRPWHQHTPTHTKVQPVKFPCGQAGRPAVRTFACAAPGYSIAWLALATIHIRDGRECGFGPHPARGRPAIRHRAGQGRHLAANQSAQDRNGLARLVRCCKFTFANSTGRAPYAPPIPAS